jgi:hypothetical protein
LNPLLYSLSFIRQNSFLKVCFFAKENQFVLSGKNPSTANDSLSVVSGSVAGPSPTPSASSIHLHMTATSTGGASTGSAASGGPIESPSATGASNDTADALTTSTAKDDANK